MQLSLREVWPGAALAAVLLQATFQVLPLFFRLSSEVVALQALGASALLLIWLYVMANVIVFGAEVNWWHARTDETRSQAWPEGRPGVASDSSSSDRRASAGAARARCECWPLPRVAELGDRALLAGRGRRSGRSRSPRRRGARRDRALEHPGAARSSPSGARATSSQT